MAQQPSLRTFCADFCRQEGLAEMGTRDVMRVAITRGEHAGLQGVAVASDGSRLQVRVTDGRWPFPRLLWACRRDCERVAVDPLAGLEPAPF